MKISAPNPVIGVHRSVKSDQVTGDASMTAGNIRPAGNFINTALHRATHLTQRFIRWVRVWIYKQAPWRESLIRLRDVWGLPS
jgi:hypothetical protein